MNEKNALVIALNMTFKEEMPLRTEVNGIWSTQKIPCVSLPHVLFVPIYATKHENDEAVEEIAVGNERNEAAILAEGYDYRNGDRIRLESARKWQHCDGITSIRVQAGDRLRTCRHLNRDKIPDISVVQGSRRPLLHLGIYSMSTEQCVVTNEIQRAWCK
ncbi:hypothetical protein ES702_01566 [subsurface metagenome]